MARIPAVAERDAGLVGRLVYRMARRRFGDVPEPFAVARHHRKLFWAGLVSEAAYLKASTLLPGAVREIASRSAAVTHSVYFVFTATWRAT